MAMKCVAQIPHPVAAPAHASQLARARPRVAQARWNRLTATTLARKQTRPASTTSRQSCSPVRQVRTRNIVYAHVLDWPPYMDTRRVVFLMLRAEHVGETSLRFDCHDPSLAGGPSVRYGGGAFVRPSPAHLAPIGRKFRRRLPLAYAATFC